VIEFRMLGTLSLSDATGHEVRGLLTQPRRLALLAYLAAARPPGFQRRDTLLALFWPELDQAHARAALRQSLHVLRSTLGDAILTRGDEDVGLDTQRLWCDVAAFDRAAETGADEEALDLYRGQFLEGFFISEAPAFERWVDGERVRLREAAGRSATALTRRLEASGDVARAAAYARRAVRLAPDDEEAARTLMSLLNRLGDRAGALSAYAELAGRLAREYEADPAPETQALISGIRSRTQAEAGATTSLPTVATHRGEGSGEVQAGTPAAAQQSRRFAATALVVMLLASVAVAVSLRPRATDLRPSRVVVAAFINRTGDSSLDPVGDLVADWISRELLRTGLVEVADPGPGLRRFGAIPEARGRAPTLDAHTLAVSTGSGISVSGGYYRRGDSIEFQARIGDERRGTLARGLPPVTAPLADPGAAVPAVSQRVTAGLATILHPRLREWTALASAPPSIEAYRALSDGIDAWYGQLDARRALPFFYRAAALDSSFTLPLAWAAWAHRGLGECAQTDSLGRALAAWGEPLAPFDRYLVERDVALCHGDRAAAYRVSQRLAEALPGSEMMAKDLARDALGIGRPREAIAILTRLHPERGALRGHAPYYLFLTSAYHLLGEHGRELAAARQARRQLPDNLAALRMELFALAALGRVDDVRRRLHEVPMLPRHPIRQPGRVMREAAMELRAHGHDAASRDVLHHTLLWLDERPADERRTEAWRFERLLTLMDAERWTEARHAAAQLVALRPDDPGYVGAAASAAAATGDRAGAEAAERRLASLARSAPRGLVPYWRACVSAHLGQHDRVITLIIQAHSEGWGLPQTAERFVGRWDLHVDPCFRAVRGDPRYRELVRPKG
jgi:serine/threonine-protein kinase